VLRNIFGKKKQEEPDYDPLNLKVTDISDGFIFEYDLKQWEVQNEATYDWGDEYFCKELKISSGGETYFMSVEEDDEIEIELCKKIKLSQIDADIEGEVRKYERPPANITFKGVDYKREKESPGYYNPSKSSSEWTEFISWQYYDESGEKVLYIEQWGENEFEASEGKSIKPFEITNILPRE
jgi:hypothetical protein